MDSLQREDTVGKTGFFITFGRSSAILGASDMWHIQMPLLKEMGWWKSALLLRFAVRSCGVDQNTRRSCFLFPYEASRDQRLFLKVRCYRSEFRPLPPERRIWWLFLKLFIRPFGFFSLPGTIWESHCGENCFILKESAKGVVLFSGWKFSLKCAICASSPELSRRVSFFHIARACVNIYKIGSPILCSFPIDFELDMHKIELE